IGVSAGVADHVGSAVNSARGLAADAANDAVRTAQGAVASGVDSAAKATHILRAAISPHSPVWRSGRWLHVPLSKPGKEGLVTAERDAKKIAEELATHPDVLVAYWDGGLERLVVQAVEDAASDRVSDALTAAAERHGLTMEDATDDRLAHPGDVGDVRVA